MRDSRICTPSIVAMFVLCLLPLSLTSTVNKPVNCSAQDSENDLPDNLNLNNLWPGGIVKYELDFGTLSKTDFAAILDALREITLKTCITFQQRSVQDASFTTIGTDNSICGEATRCHQQSPSYTRFGGECRNKRTMVHELGHTLCLPHERMETLPVNNYRNFSQVPISTKFTHLYDFWSQMASQNGPADEGNWYKMFDAITREQWHNDSGLSVMDADKINSMYDCQGCYSHRWKFISQLNEEDQQYMIRFGRTVDGKPLYACRGYVNRELCVGKYRADEGICYLSWGGREFIHKEWAQVYLDPAWVRGEVPSKGIYNPDKDLGDEHFFRIREGRIVLGKEEGNEKPKPEEIENIKKVLIPAGSKYEGNTVVIGHIVVAVLAVNGTQEKVIGKLWGHDIKSDAENIVAHFPVDGKEVILKDFYIFRCNDETFQETNRSKVR